MSRQLDHGEDLDVQAQLLAVEQHDLAADQARGLETLEPPPARRLGQADLGGQLGGGEAGVTLDGGEQAAIEGVEFDGHRFCADVTNDDNEYRRQAETPS